MKSLKEKKMLARLARNAGQPDLALEESIEREERLSRLFEARQMTKEEVVVVEQALEKSVEVISEGEFIQEVAPPKAPEPPPAAEPIGTIPNPPKIVLDMQRAELQGLRKQIQEINSRISTLAFGGGGTGVVRFDALDDATIIYNRMDSKVYTFLQDTPPLLANGADQWINTASGLEYTNINTGQMVIPTWVEFGPALTQNVADPEPVWFNYPFTAVTSDNYTVANSDFYIGVNYDGNVAITLPTQPEVANGHTCVIKDESGNASGATNWIDIYASGADKIDGNDYVRLQIDHGSLTLFYRGGWRII